MPNSENQTANRNNQGPRRPPVFTWVVIAIVLFGALVGFLAYEFPEAMDGDGVVRMVFFAGVLVLVVSALFAHRGLKLSQGIKYAAIWALIGLVLLLGYTFKDRLMGALLPHQGVQESANAVSYGARQSGHFVVEGRAEDTPVRFLVDTGASLVVLSPDDARRIGLDPDGLDYSQRVATANGMTWAAPVTLKRLSVGPITLSNVRASVNRAAMDMSLLGMSFLNRLSGYEVRGDKLILRR